MNKFLPLLLVLLPATSYVQTCNLLNHNCSNTTGLNVSGVTASVGSIYGCGPGNSVLYSSSSNSYVATGDIAIVEGAASTLQFKAKRSAGYSSTCEVWVHVGGYCNYSLLSFPFDDNGWVQIGTFIPNTICTTFGPYTVNSDVIGGQKLSYCIVPKNATSTNWVAIDDICVSEISGSPVATTMDEDFGTSSTGWYPNVGVSDIPYHTYKNASDAYVILGTGVDGGSDRAAYFYTGFDFCSSVSATGIITKEINTSGFSNGEIRLEFKSKYPCSGANSYTFDENYQNYSPEIYVMQGADHGSNSWVPLPVNYYFADYAWRVASYDISAYNNANVRFKIERGGFCGTSMEAVDNIKILDRDCSISLLSCGAISGDVATDQNTNYVYSVPAVVGANYYKWYVRDGGTLYDASPYIVSGQGTQSATINFNNLLGSGVRVLCIPFDADPSVDTDACYAEIGYLGVTVSAISPLSLNVNSVVEVTCNGANDGAITVSASGGQPGYAYSWAPNVSSTNTALGLAGGAYTITVTDANLDQIAIVVNVPEPQELIVTAPADFSICDGLSAQLTPTLSGGALPYGYSWSPALAISSTSVANPVVNPTSDQTYTLTVTDANLCTAGDDVLVTVNPLPIPLFTSDVVSGCQPLLVNFVSTTAGASVSCDWDFGDGNTTSSCSGVSNVYSSNGMYTVQLGITDNNGCQNTVSYTNYIEVYLTPTVDAGIDTSICTGDSLTVAATNPDGGTLTWNNGVTDGILFEVLTSGYYVVESESPDGCIGSDSLLVTLNSLPIVNLGADITSCDPSITLDAGSGFTSYLWSNSQTTQTIDATSSGLYWVEVESNGCVNSDSIDLVLLDCAGIVQFAGNEVSVYPNPAKNSITIKGLKTGTFVEVMDLNGNLIQSRNAINVNWVLDISHYADGIYFINLSGDGDKKTLKFIKQ